MIRPLSAHRTPKEAPAAVNRLISHPLRLAVAALLTLALLLPAGLPSLTPAHAAEDETQTVKASDGTATVTSVKTVREGAEVTVTGTGWKAQDGSGSNVSVKLDKGKTTIGGDAVVATVDANAQGEFSATFPFPGKDNANEAWTVGSTHTIHVLSGSGKTGDVARNAVLTVGVAKADGTTVDPDDPQHWDSYTIPGKVGDTAVDDATVRIAPIGTGDGARLKLHGEGWTMADGKRGSVIAVKLLKNSKGDAYTRTPNTKINDYLTARAGNNDSVWVLLTPDQSKEDKAAGIFHIDEKGEFDVDIALPDGLKQGQYLKAQFLSGKNAEYVDASWKDVQRSTAVGPLKVDGVAADEDSQTSDVKCTDVTSRPTVTVETKNVGVGGKVHVTGSGYCNPTANTGAAHVAVKLDEGKYSRLDDAVSTNRTIWQIIETDQSNGTFDAWIQLPDGTDKTSTPAFPEGAHTLRFLSGSLKPGDKGSTVGGAGVADFVVGQYRPQGAPDPVDPGSALTSGNRHGVSATLDGDKLTVTVPEGRQGDWIHTSAYMDGSRRSAWLGEWHQLDARRSVTYTVDREVLMAGKYQLLVQNGNEGHVGEILGWTTLELKDTGSGESGSSGGHGTSGSGRATATSPNRTSGTAEQTSGPVAGSGSTSVLTGAAVPGGNASSLSDTAQDQTSYVVVRRAPGSDTETVVKRVVKKKVAKKPTASPSAQAAQAQQAQGSGQDQDQAAAQSTARKHSWFSWENLLLVAAAAILLALVLTGGKKKTQTTAGAAGSASDSATKD
ncbi:hypothetical protein AB0O80_00675 [Rothia kristinae]|uniref:hypothetical protein n=1 Tax=Rothia kristinae TaxID=37923 RepID=UPI00341BA08B